MIIDLLPRVSGWALQRQAVARAACACALFAVPVAKMTSPSTTHSAYCSENVPCLQHCDNYQALNSHFELPQIAQELQPRFRLLEAYGSKACATALCLISCHAYFDSCMI